MNPTRVFRPSPVEYQALTQSDRNVTLAPASNVSVNAPPIVSVLFPSMVQVADDSLTIVTPSGGALIAVGSVIVRVAVQTMSQSVAVGV